MPFMSGASFNGDLATMTFGFSAQSDESRHMTLGLGALKFMLEQDEGNVPIIQDWLDKWFWRGIPAAQPGRRDDGLHAPQAVHELEGGVRALLRGADAGRAVPRVLRYPPAPPSAAGDHREGLHEPPGVLAALHLQPRALFQHHDPGPR